MNVIQVKLDDLHTLTENVRSHPRKQIDEYKRSLEMFGQTKNAVIDEENTVLIGNGLVMAARELGWDSIFAIVKAGMSPAAKKKIVMSDNKIFDMGVDNYQVIEAYIEELKDDLDIPGYDEAILKQMMATAEEVTEDINQFGILPQSEIQSLNERAEAAEARQTTTEVQYAPEAGHSDGTADTSPVSAPLSPDTDDDDIPFAPEKFVMCPKCNEKIWL